MVNVMRKWSVIHNVLLRCRFTRPRLKKLSTGKVTRSPIALRTTDKSASCMFLEDDGDTIVHSFKGWQKRSNWGHSLG